MESHVGFISLVVLWFIFLTLHNLSMGKPDRPTHGRSGRRTHGRPGRRTHRPDMDPRSTNSEVNALIDFKNGVNDHDNLLGSWEATRPSPCRWTGISCDHDDDSGRVQEINLGNAGLRGPISSSLGSLANLKRLALYQNQLTGSIPKELGNLTNLQWLYLQSNRLTGPIPEELGKLKSIKILWLQNNTLCGVSPTSKWTSLPKTANINLKNNPRLCNPNVKPENCPPCK